MNILHSQVFLTHWTFLILSKALFDAEMTEDVAAECGHGVAPPNQIHANGTGQVSWNVLGG
jgi:hypothetical protein